LDLEKVKFFHSSANCAATDLFNNSYSMIGVDDLIAYVEIAVAQHEETPTSGQERRNSTQLFYPKLVLSAIWERVTVQFASATLPVHVLKSKAVMILYIGLETMVSSNLPEARRRNLDPTCKSYNFPRACQNTSRGSFRKRSTRWNMSSV